MFFLTRHELLRHLRSRRLAVWAFSYAALAFAIITLLWPGRTWHTADIGIATRTMLELLSALLAAAAALVVPAYAASSVAIERERETYDSLRLSLLSPAALVMGKLLNVFGIFALIFAAGMPVLASTYFLLGIDVSLMSYLALLGVAVASSSAGIGLACSAACRRMLVAQTFTFLFIFALLMASSALFSLAPVALSFLFQQSVLYRFAPVHVLQSLVAGVVPIPEILRFAGVHLLAGSVGVVAAMVLIAGDRRIDSTVQSPLERVATATVKVRRRRSRFKAIPAWLNPVLIREARWGELMSWRWQLRLFLLSSMILAGGLWAMTAGLVAGIPPSSAMWVALQMSLALFLVPGMTTSAIVQERARRTFDFLLMTRLRLSSVFLGKVGGVLLSCTGLLLPCLLSIALAPTVYPSMTVVDACILITGFASLMVWMFVCSCASTYVCAAVDCPTAAFAGSYILCILIFCGFGAGLLNVKFYGTGSAFISPVLGFVEKAADAGANPLAQFSGPWIWHIVTHLLVGFLFIFLALREAEPFVDARRCRWQ